MTGSIKKVEKNLIFAYGLLGTMPIISIFGLTIFSWLTVIVVLFFIIFKLSRNAKVTKFITPYFIIVLLSVISAFLCLSGDLPAVWKNQQVKGIIWNVFYIIVLIYFSNKHNDAAKSYLEGVYISSIIHMVWGYLQFILYTISGIKLNDVVFVDLLHMSTNTLTQIKDGNIALSGLCWNAGNMAPLLLFGFAMSTSISLRAAFALCTLLSGSRTAVLGLSAFVLFSYITESDKSKVSKRIWMSVMGVVIIGIPVLFLTGRMSPIIYAIQTTFSYFSRETLARQSSAIIHLRYLTSIFDVAKFAGLIKTLFGFGIGCSGYPFTVLFNQFNTPDFGPWVVECDIINQLWSTGVLALIIRYLWYMKYFVKAYKVDRNVFSFFLAFFIEGFAYNVTFNWTLILLMCIFILINNKQKIKNYQKNEIFDYYSHM